MLILFFPDGFGSPLNFDPKNRPRRQDWKGEFVENGMFYMAKTKIILNVEMKNGKMEEKKRGVRKKN